MNEKWVEGPFKLKSLKFNINIALIDNIAATNLGGCMGKISQSIT